MQTALILQVTGTILLVIAYIIRAIEIDKLRQELKEEKLRADRAENQLEFTALVNDMLTRQHAGQTEAAPLKK